MVSEVDNKILELKKKKVIETVYRIVKSRNLPVPEINFEGCPDESQYQLAHYHPDLNMICFSKRQLIRQTLDDLEATTVHEVSHILEQNHDAGFYKEESISSITNFRPPPGVILTMEGQKGEEIKVRKSKPDKSRCNYHICRKQRKLTQCKHCKKWYCSEHITPKPPHMPKFNRYSTIDLDDIDDLNSSNSHPCPPYVDYLIKKEKEESKRYEQNLDKLLKTKPSSKGKTTKEISIEPFEEKEIPKEKVIVESEGDYESGEQPINRNNWWVYAIIIVIIIIVLKFLKII